MKKYTISYNLFLLLYIVLLIFTLSRYYKSGHILLGGEGNYYLDFDVHFNTHGYAWLNLATGFFGTSLNADLFNGYFLIFLQNLFGNIGLVNFILFFLIYFLPFLGIFFVCKELKIIPLLSFGISLFYVVNPFSLNYLASLNQWNTTTLSLIPILFWIILRYFDDNFKLFFYFGFISFIFAFSNANPPLAILHQISIALSVIIISYYLKPVVLPVQVLKKYITILASFILFNACWILNWFYVLGDVKKMWTPSSALSWLTSSGLKPIFRKILTFTADIPSDPTYSFLSKHYNSKLAVLVMLIPISIILFSIYTVMIKRPRKHILYLSISLLVTIFLMNGIRYPLGKIYGYLVSKNFIFFSIFKTPTEKWGILYVFIFTLLLIFTLNELKKERYYKYILILFAIYLLFCSIPFITGNFIPDYKVGTIGYGSRSYVDRIEYQKLREQINNDCLEYRVLSLPGSVNYQVMLPVNGNKYYTGMDPIVSNLYKPFIAAYSNNILVNYDLLFNNISSPRYDKFLSIYNIKKVVLNKDLYPWFGFKQKEDILELEKIFSKTMPYKKYGSLVVFDNLKNFLPRIYPANVPIFIDGGEDEMFKVVTSGKFTMNNKVIFLSNKINKTQWNFLRKYMTLGKPSPVITFQKINPAKYIVKIENATSGFFLVFLETYHPGWRAYLESNPFRFNEVIAEYNDINVKEARHKRDFILGDVEYLFKKLIVSQDRHFLVNGYANGWYLDKAGTYYITLYYWPQLLFYAGFIISCLAFFVCLGYLILRLAIEVLRRTL